MVGFEDATKDFEYEKLGKVLLPARYNLVKRAFLSTPWISVHVLTKALADELEGSTAFESVRVVKTKAEAAEGSVLVEGKVREATLLLTGSYSGTYSFTLDLKATSLPEGRVIMEKSVARRVEYENSHTPAAKEILSIMQDMMAEAAGGLAAALNPNPPAKAPALVTASAPPARPAALKSNVDVDVPRLAAPNPNAVAVVIGNKDYRNKDIPPAEFALNDARSVRQYFVRALGVPDGNVIYQENATKGDFETIFGSKDSPRGQLADYVRPGRSDVYVYYSGHGAPGLEDHKSYFVPSDGNPNYIANNGYALDLLYSNLARLKVRSVTVILDSCFSGGSDKGMLIAKASPLILKTAPVALPSNIVLLASSTGEQISSWYQEKGHSLYTYFFLKALQNAAGRAEALRFDALQHFLNENVPPLARKLHGRKQTPVFTGDGGAFLAKP